MASSLPFAFRVAAGLIAETLDAVRRLPTDVSALPITVVGQLAKLSFQLNQQLTDLAGQGDRLIATLHQAEPPPERTAWSTIDDEDDTDKVARRDPQAATWDRVAAEPRDQDSNGESTVTPITDSDSTDDPQRVAESSPAAHPHATTARRRPGGSARSRPAPRPADSGTASSHSATTAGAPTATSLSDASGATSSSPTGIGAGSANQTSRRRPPTQRRPADHVRLVTVNDGPLDAEPPVVAETTTPEPEPSAVDPRPVGTGTAGWTLAELRSQVRSLPIDEVREALTTEQRGRGRPAFLTILTNRLATLERDAE